MSWLKLKIARWIIRNSDVVSEEWKEWAYRYYNSH